METKDKRRPPTQGKRSVARVKTVSNGKTPQNRKSIVSARVATATRPAPVRKPVARKHQPKSASKQPTPEVVYTQPGPFNRNRLLLRLATVVAVVLALVFGISIFFKVDTITVAGNEKYSGWEVMEASGIRIGDNLLGLNDAKITGNIISDLPYVSAVRIGIKLPDTVKIEIVELDVVYSVEAEDGSWWLMRADGGIVEKTNSTEAELHTKVLGVKLSQPTVGERAVAAQPISDETTAEGQEVPVVINAAQQLDTAISILQYMEASGVIGDATSVNVGDLRNLELWYGTRYQVIIGDVTQLSYKIKSMKAAIDQMGDYQDGTLDVSFTTWPNQVGYTPFP